MIAEVSYYPRGGAAAGPIATARVSVNYEAYDKKFSATNLALWGCGKMAATPEGAVRNLVQDMAQIVSITIVEA